jgi:hypothetical protein
LHLQVMPRSLTDDELGQVAAFRSTKRLPALVYK